MFVWWWRIFAQKFCERNFEGGFLASRPRHAHVRVSREFCTVRGWFEMMRKKFLAFVAFGWYTQIAVRLKKKSNEILCKKDFPMLFFLCILFEMHDYGAAFLLLPYSEIAIFGESPDDERHKFIQMGITWKLCHSLNSIKYWKIIHITFEFTQNRIFSNLNISVRVFVAICKTSAVRSSNSKCHFDICF